MCTIEFSVWVASYISRGTLYLASLGDYSSTVFGCLNEPNKIVHKQITRHHNAGMREIRKELRSLHPGVWASKAIQVGSIFRGM